MFINSSEQVLDFVKIKRAIFYSFSSAGNFGCVRIALRDGMYA